MPQAWPRIVSSTPVTNALPATAVETVTAQLAITDAGADQRVLLHWWGRYITGVATTSVIFRIRRDGVAGTIVSNNALENIIGAVGENHSYMIEASDNPGDVASQIYVVTVQQTGATGAGSIQAQLFTAIVGG